LGRLLESALVVSHGTILLCTKEVDVSLIPELKDSTLLYPFLDFHLAFNEFKMTGTAGSILMLQRCEDLLHGFLRCDGMIVFDTLGHVTAYRVFFQAAQGHQPVAEVVGGARRRAFEGVKALVGHHLVCTLFRSQDGHMLYQGEAA
jgi:hypothetical protein